mmetsp:Transcript_30800/g.69101  ORF Transcript_30800/g.69101 Transcript_30800/m.69101 type:complete len:215 (+) Transcript_30800:111-755(+)
MTSVSTLANKSALAPAARNEHAETSSGRKPSDGPMERTVSRKVSVIMEGVTLRGEVHTVARGVVGSALWARRWMTRLITARTGHRKASPLRPRPMTSPRTPFFWSVKVSETKVAHRIWASVAVVRSMRVCPMKSWTSVRRKGVDSSADPSTVYFPGRRRKKNAIIIMSAVALLKSWLDARARYAFERRTWTGMGLTRLGGGSSFFQALIILERR